MPCTVSDFAMTFVRIYNRRLSLDHNAKGIRQLPIKLLVYVVIGIQKNDTVRRQREPTRSRLDLEAVPGLIGI